MEHFAGLDVSVNAYAFDERTTKAKLSARSAHGEPNFAPRSQYAGIIPSAALDTPGISALTIIYSHFFQRKNRYGPIAAQTISIIANG